LKPPVFKLLNRPLKLILKPAVPPRAPREAKKGLDAGRIS
jgi:hypothetical protein